MAEPEVRLVVFLLELPQPLAIADGSTFTFHTGENIEGLPSFDHITPVPGVEPITISRDAGNALVSFRVWQVEPSELTEPPYLEAIEHVLKRLLPESIVPRGTEKNERPSTHGYRTVVEAVTPIRMDNFQDDLTLAFDRCELQLFKLLDAYRIVAPRMIGHVAREVLPPWIPFITRDLNDLKGWDADGIRFLHLNYNVPHNEPPLDDEAMKKFQFMLSSTVVGHSFTAYSLLSKEAATALTDQGDTAGAVIKAQIASEVLLDGVLSSLLWEEGMDPAQAGSEIFQEGLIKRVRTHYHPRIGGIWKTEGNAVVAQWRHKLVGLRGRVVHGDYTPTREEARAALDSLDKLDSVVRRRLAISRNKYPRTTLMLLGGPGLRRLKSWAGKIVKFLEEQAGDEPDWRVHLREWQDQMNNAR